MSLKGLIGCLERNWDFAEVDIESLIVRHLHHIFIIQHHITCLHYRIDQLYRSAGIIVPESSLLSPAISDMCLHIQADHRLYRAIFAH